MNSASEARGSLVCVGLGMMLGAHLGARARAQIEQADVVFVAASDALVEAWVRQLRPDARSLQVFYAEGRPRSESYRGMVDAMLAEVRAGRRVCGAFYGHPGVFARVPHQAIAAARGDGFAAAMEPAVSADACLYADLGIDPGDRGCAHYEASQLLLYRRAVDPSAYLVLWQVGVVGDRSASRTATGPAYRRLLVERLLEDYPSAHPVIIYEAATVPVLPPRIERIPLAGLPEARLAQHSTLVVPPVAPLRRDEGIHARLLDLDRLHHAPGSLATTRAADPA